MTATPQRRRSSLLHLLPPAGFAAGYVLISFSATPTPITGLLRPLIIAVVAAVLLAALIALVLRSPAWGGVVASALVVFASALWLPMIIIGTVVLWLVLITVMRWIQKRPSTHSQFRLARISRVTAIFSTFFAAVSLIASLPQFANGLAIGGDMARAVPNADSPDIVIVLLDGYPRSDVLAEGFSFDNRPFETALTDLGFDIKAESRSNYSTTWPTIASMLSGAYLQDLPDLEPFPTDQTEQYQVLSRVIDSAPLPSVLRDHGYEVAWVAGPFEDVALNTADRLITGGQLTAFELSLLQHSPILPALLAVAPDFLLEQHRDRIEHALDQVPLLVAPHDGPTFAVVHVVSPHPPITFDADGRLASPAACLPDCSLWALVDEEQWSQFPGQVEHLNSLVLEAVAAAVSANRGAVIAVMSDHGTQPPEADDELVLDNFTAVRMPDDQRDAVSEDVSPVNLLSEIFNAVVGTDLATFPYRAWISEAEYPLTMNGVR